ncbi:MAG TPA: HEAT repeat domain-containing protein [Pirellulaceae bacterium]|nr:HEAT repeat domain-containing protein [Pirellulaceae bacterium]
MGIERSRVQLVICTEDELPDATGLYVAGEPAVIKIRDWLLGEPEQLVATLAHELAHEILLGGGLLNTNNDDLERLTDLLPAYLGVGAFAANATIRETNLRTGRFSWWEMSRHGYLPSRHFGYAMALFSYVRQDQDTSWARMLRPDVAEPFRAGLKYLRKTHDSLFTRQSAEQPSDALCAAELLRQLDSPSATIRIHALWELAECGDQAAAAVPRVTRCLDDRDPDIVAHAADTLAALGPAAVPAASRLVEVLHGRDEAARKSAAYALGQIGAAPELVVPELVRALDDDDLPVVKAAAWSLGRYGPAARRGMKPLLRGYERFLKRADDGIDVFAQAIASVAENPLAEVDAFFAEKDDAELHRFAIAELESAMTERDEGVADAADV